MKAREVNFDGLVGLTHHYAGLSFGNEASTKHRFQVSNPRLAAKQGLLKMKALADAGFPQAVIPPHERPYIPVLRQLGFSGSDEQVLDKVARQAPHWLSSARVEATTRAVSLRIISILSFSYFYDTHATLMQCDVVLTRLTLPA